MDYWPDSSLPERRTSWLRCHSDGFSPVLRDGDSLSQVPHKWCAKGREGFAGVDVRSLRRERLSPRQFLPHRSLWRRFERHVARTCFKLECVVDGDCASVLCMLSLLSLLLDAKCVGPAVLMIQRRGETFNECFNARWEYIHYIMVIFHNILSSQVCLLDSISF